MVFIYIPSHHLRFPVRFFFFHLFSGGGGSLSSFYLDAVTGLEGVQKPTALAVVGDCLRVRVDPGQQFSARVLRQYSVYVGPL